MRRWTEIDWSPHVRERRVEGRRVRYADYGDGSPIVLVHGLGGAWTAGHCPMFEVPDAFNRALLAFSERPMTTTTKGSM